MFRRRISFVIVSSNFVLLLLVDSINSTYCSFFSVTQTILPNRIKESLCHSSDKSLTHPSTTSNVFTKMRPIGLEF
ncbi:hypothetical protein BJV78DRAFT_1209673, partial [Lactifluus subvellereus]